MKVGRWLRGGLGACCLLAAGLALAGDDAAFETMRAADLRLARIAWRLNVGNAALCHMQEPGTGLVLHALGAYQGGDRERVRVAFDFTTAIGAEGVIPDSPADRAGLRRDDSIASIAGVPFDAALPTAGAPTTRVLRQVADGLAARPATGEIQFVVQRRGVPLVVTVDAIPSCRARLELLLDKRFDASSSPGLIQIGYGFLDSYDDTFVAAVVAHELAHLVLGHHAELTRTKGGRRAAAVRRTEIEADRLSVYLLANAGYDPMDAARFWRRYGPEHGCTLLCGPGHPAWSDRAAALGKEAASIPPDAARPLRPAYFAGRLRPIN